MDKNRKKELKQQYAEARPEMGILLFHCIPAERKYFIAAPDVKSKQNGLRMRFNNNMYPGSRNRNIQADWNQYGECKFEIKVVDILEYDKDESKTDYSGELAMLLEDWIQNNPGSEEIL